MLPCCHAQCFPAPCCLPGAAFPRAPSPIVAALLSPCAWLYGRPDLFDSYSVGVLLMQLVSLLVLRSRCDAISSLLLLLVSLLWQQESWSALVALQRHAGICSPPLSVL